MDYLLLVIISVIIALVIVKALSQINEYDNSTLIDMNYGESRTEKMKRKGEQGEYYTFKNLSSFQKDGATFLFNIYVPAGNGTTTEIDQIMICRKGIIVIESKNYKGWIYGSFTAKYWIQMLPNGRRKPMKRSFYNPIMQNGNHIKHLKELLKEKIPMFSVIVFSDDSELKKVPINTDNLKIINRNHVDLAVKRIYDTHEDVLDDEKIKNIFNKLFPYTMVCQETKMEHIQNIRDKYKR